MASDIVRPDASGRISLARFGVEPGQTFEVVKAEETGRIVLYPVATPKTYLEQFAEFRIGQAFKLPGAVSAGYLFVKVGEDAMVRVLDGRTRYFEDLADGYSHWANHTDTLTKVEDDTSW